MGTVKKIIGIGLVTGVVLYAYLRTLGVKLDRGLVEGKKENAQLDLSNTTY